MDMRMLRHPKRKVSSLIESKVEYSGFIGFVSNSFPSLNSNNAKPSSSSINSKGFDGNCMLFGDKKYRYAAYDKSDPRLGKDWQRLESTYSNKNSDGSNSNSEESELYNSKYAPPPFHLQRPIAKTTFDFDYHKYNRTAYAGLERLDVNAYTNAVLQLFFFVPELRRALLVHLAQGTPEVCLSDEVGFLFHMMLSSHGSTKVIQDMAALHQSKEEKNEYQSLLEEANKIVLLSSSSSKNNNTHNHNNNNNHNTHNNHNNNNKNNHTLYDSKVASRAIGETTAAASERLGREKLCHSTNFLRYVLVLLLLLLLLLCVGVVCIMCCYCSCCCCLYYVLLLLLCVGVIVCIMCHYYYY